jgi:hypothetical protein
MIKGWWIGVPGNARSYSGPFMPDFTSTIFSVILAVLRTELFPWQLFQPVIPAVIPLSYSSWPLFRVLNKTRQHRRSRAG